MIRDRPLYYVLIGQTAVPCEDDPLKWSRLNFGQERRVAQTRVMTFCQVSTVFLGLDHAFFSGPPLLFETMVFWHGEHGYEQERCSTWEQAEAMHREMIDQVRRPGAVAAFVRRTWREAVEAAREDWRDAWRELRGRPREPEMWDTMKARLDDPASQREFWW